MKAELQKKLFQKYPKIFADKDKSMKESLMCFGIETEDGWYWLIDNLCNTIQGYIDNNNKPQIKGVQVKEKFGRLRFYINSSDELIEGMIWLAEDLSGTICEMCGTTKEVGKTSGWIRTICDKCRRLRHNNCKEWTPIAGSNPIATRDVNSYEILSLEILNING